MSDLMLLGILRMPMPELPDRAQVVTYTQFVQTARQAADRIEELEQQNAGLRDALELMVNAAEKDGWPKAADHLLPITTARTTLKGTER